MRLVVKIGGSLAISGNGPNAAYLRKLIPVLTQLSASHQLIVAIGGGQFVRNYYAAVKPLKLPDEEKEWLAIELLRANVRLLASLTGLQPIFSLDEVDEHTSGVIGGIAPGRSTDANAALAAAHIHADYFIKLTNVDGMYDKDPKKRRSAKKISAISFGELKRYAVPGAPGSYGVLDPTAIDTIVAHRIPTIVMNGGSPKNLLKAVTGARIGTRIS